MLWVNAGRLLRKRREQLGWRTSDVASRAGVAEQIVKEIEAGVPSAIAVQQLPLVAAALGTTREAVIGAGEFG